MCEPSSFLQSCLPVAKSLLGISYISYLAPYSRPVAWLPHPLEHHIGRSACRSPHRDHKRVAMGVTLCLYPRETARMTSATTRILDLHTAGRRARNMITSAARAVVASGSEYFLKNSIGGGEVLTVGFIRQVAIRALSSRVPPKATPMEGVGAC